VRFALGKLGVAPNDAIFVGDSPHDIESGNAAGVETVGVTWGAFSREEIAHANPNAWIASMPELMPLVDRAR